MNILIFFKWNILSSSLSDSITEHRIMQIRIHIRACPRNQCLLFCVE